MNHEKISPHESEQGEARLQKIVYLRPTLKVYGSVSLLTQSGGNSASEGQSGMAHTMTSDRRVKENIVEIGTHPLGIGLYLFDYKPEFRAAWGHGRQLGVMADEVETVRPEAVLVHPNGYKMVDYGLLN